MCFEDLFKKEVAVILVELLLVYNYYCINACYVVVSVVSFFMIVCPVCVCRALYVRLGALYIFIIYI